MRIVVTGSNGFIGSWLTRRAVHAGHQVWGVVRPWRPGPSVDGPFVRAEARDPSDLGPILRDARPDVLVHLAWPVPPRTYRHDGINIDGLHLTGQIFDEAAAAGVPHVIGIGTCLELADTDAPRLERDTPAPSTLYGTCKDAARQLGERLLSDVGTTFTWARLFHVYGPGEPRGRLTREALEAFREGRSFRTTPGAQIRDWMHVADVADALLALAEARPGGIAHVCGGSVTDVATHLTALARGCGTRDLLEVGGRPYGIDEQMAILGVPATLQRIGFQARLSPADARNHVVEAFRTRTWHEGGPSLPAPRRPVGLDHLELRMAA